MGDDEQKEGGDGDEAEEPEEEMDLDAGDMGELPEITLTPDQAQAIIALGDMLKPAVDMGEPEVEDLPAPAMDAMDGMEEEPMMEDMVNEVARRVARRLNEMKKSK